MRALVSAFPQMPHFGAPIFAEVGRAPAAFIRQKLSTAPDMGGQTIELMTAGARLRNTYFARAPLSCTEASRADICVSTMANGRTRMLVIRVANPGGEKGPFASRLY
ncbi:hypothetical protein [Caballeronia sp. 15715]|uniref:hypothetical protein n=1 Tax=unclassified Caballeronia TaxID=2646786 RepID=UPI0039E38EB4